MWGGGLTFLSHKDFEIHDGNLNCSRFLMVTPGYLK